MSAATSKVIINKNLLYKQGKSGFPKHIFKKNQTPEIKLRQISPTKKNEKEEELFGAAPDLIPNCIHGTFPLMVTASSPAPGISEHNLKKHLHAPCKENGNYGNKMGTKDRKTALYDQHSMVSILRRWTKQAFLSPPEGDKDIES